MSCCVSLVIISLFLSHITGLYFKQKGVGYGGHEVVAVVMVKL